MWKLFDITKKKYFDWLNQMHYVLYGDSMLFKTPELEVPYEPSVSKPNHYTKAITRLRYRHKFLDNNNY